MDLAEALAEIDALKAGLFEAGDSLLTAAERGMALAAATPPDSAAIQSVFTEILTLCAFQDLSGQRLDRLAGLMRGHDPDARPDAGLLHGPALRGGLDQAAADALFVGD